MASLAPPRARISKSCAEECEKHTKHSHCAICAQACRACEQACRELLATLG
ncbi:four-helix bundle copper-binding protein [Streptosporangium sp. NPDC001682]